ncbi:MAG: universal stress protein [Acidobacteria bacterium]|nr:universal stress protein [Acidobacteriota bacterium]
MKILLATDGSAQATTALRTAASLLRRSDAQFELLCVTPELGLPKSRTPKNPQKAARLIEDYRKRIEVEAHEHLLRAKSLLSTLGIEAGMRVEAGSPASVITRTAAEYDLTVVGAHNRYARTNLGLGPVASRVVATAPGGVIIGRELSNVGRQWRILAAVDGSLASEAALSLCASALELSEAEITLLHVAETPWVNLGLDRDWFDARMDDIAPDDSAADAMMKSELQREGTALAEEARQQLERLGLTAGVMTAEGDPALEILSEAERGEYDLIVLGATGVADMRHDLMGSVSTKVAQAAQCSVLVVK